MVLCRWGRISRGVGLALALAAGGGPAASAAPDGRPRTVQYLGNLADHDPAAPAPGHEPWTPAIVARLLAAHPQASVSLEPDEGPLPGGTTAARRRLQVQEIRAQAAAAGVDVADRLCVPLRIDVRRKLRPGHPECDPAAGGRGCDWEGDMDGSHGEAETVVKASGRASGAAPGALVDASARWTPGAWAQRLLVVRPGTALEEHRRIVGNDRTTLRLAEGFQQPPQPGDDYEIRGSFDPRWVQRVPAAVHAASLRRFWSERRDVCGRSRQEPCASPAEPLDPFAGGNRRGWRADADRGAITALATRAGVPALYATLRDARPGVPQLTDPYPSVEAVVMDLRQPAYRDWLVRSLLYTLEDHGVPPGGPACVIVSYEPALETWYDEASAGASRDRCALPDTASWQAPLHVCHEGAMAAGPLVPTAYGPGEYEASVNALLRELLTTLPSHGYGALRIATAEGGAFRARPWSILASDVRFDARVAGELDRARPPRLASLAETPAADAADAGGGGGSAGRAPLALAMGTSAARRGTPAAEPALATEPAGADDAAAGAGPNAPTSWSLGSSRPPTARPAATPASGRPSTRPASQAFGRPAPAPTPARGRAPLANATTSATTATGGRPAASRPAGSARGFGPSPSRPTSTASRPVPRAGVPFATGSQRPASPTAPAPTTAAPTSRPTPPAPTTKPRATPASPTPTTTTQTKTSPTVVAQVPRAGEGTTAEPAADRAHEPAGMRPRWPMNPMNSLPPVSPAGPDRYGYKCWPDQCDTLSIERDASSPGTDPSVLRITFPAGKRGGGAPSRFLAGDDFGGKRRLYTSVYAYLSANWDNNGNAGTKFFFMRARADGVHNHYVNAAGGTSAPFHTGVFLQTRDGRGNRNFPVGPVPIGRWFRLELVLEMNTPGRADGVAKLWLDGRLELERSDIEWAPALSGGRTLADVSWDYLWVDPTYGGGANPVPEEMYIQLDDWYTSVGD